MNATRSFSVSEFFGDRLFAQNRKLTGVAGGFVKQLQRVGKPILPLRAAEYAPTKRFDGAKGWIKTDDRH